MSYLPPEKALELGADILGKKLYPLGFKFRISEKGKGSGGHFAVGSFSNSDREIRIWFRFEIGGVSYRKGNLVKSHVELMQYLGLEESAKLPGFHSDDPLKGFRDLLEDLEHCGIFLNGEGEEFHRQLKDYKYRERPTGLAALERYEKK